MSLGNVLSYIRNAASKDVFQFLTDLNEQLLEFGSKLKVDAVISWTVLLCLSVLAGLLAYKVIKLFLAVGVAYVGYFVGVELLSVIECKLQEVFTKRTIDLPDWLAVVLGVLAAALFLALSYRRFSYVLFMGAAVVGYAITLFYTGNDIVGLGGGIIVALLTVLFIRVVFIWATSAFAAVLTVNFLSLLLPDVGVLAVERSNWIGLLIIVGIALLYGAIQLLTNKPAKE